MDYKEYYWKKALDLVFKVALKPFQDTKDFYTKKLNYEKALNHSLISYASKVGKDDFYRLFYENQETIFKDLKYFFELPTYTKQTLNDVEDFIKGKTKDIYNLDLFFKLFFYNLLMTDEYSDKIYKFYNSIEHDRIMQETKEIKKDTSETKNNTDKILNILESSNQNCTPSDTMNTPSENKEPIIDQKDFFIDLWNETLFLHKDPMYESICLKDAHIVPDYKYRGDRHTNLEEVIENYINSHQSQEPLIILGQPGIGKSSLVAYICSKYNSSNLIVLRFYNLEEDIIDKFDKDNNNGLLSAILHKIKCNKDDLENKTLILDGYDEITIQNRDKILNNFLYKIDKITGLKVIITSREHYINLDNFTDYKIFVLQYFDPNQVDNFCVQFNYNIGNYDEDKLEVVGIPLILYMIVSLEIDISEVNGLCELYNKIFSLGYDKNIYKRVYMNGNHITKKYKEQFYNISQNLAFMMFNLDKLELNDKDDCYTDMIIELCDKNQNIDENEKSEILENYSIANYYNKAKESILFVHKTIYEFYVAEFVYNQLSLIESQYGSLKHLEYSARILGECICNNVLSDEIERFLQYKINNLVNNKLYMMNIFNLLLEKGMTYYVSKDKHLNTILENEANIFENFISLLYLIHTENITIKIDNLLSFSQQVKNLSNFSYIIDLFNFNIPQIKLFGASLSCANLFGANLSGADFTRANLSRADLSGSDLSRANLSCADSSGSDFSRADLYGADLYGADLSYSKLFGANLFGANLSRANLSGANLFGANLSGANLSRANLFGANLSRANLFGANLSCANLSRANLFGADLSRADLSGVDLSGAKLFGADLSRAKIDIKAFNKIKHQDVKNLDKTYIYIEELKDYLPYSKFIKSKYYNPED